MVRDSLGSGNIDIHRADPVTGFTIYTGIFVSLEFYNSKKIKNPQ